MLLARDNWCVALVSRKSIPQLTFSCLCWSNSFRAGRWFNRTCDRSQTELSFSKGGRPSGVRPGGGEFDWVFSVSSSAAWFRAVQALITIGLIGIILSMILACIYLCVHSVSKNSTILALVIVCFLSGEWIKRRGVLCCSGVMKWLDPRNQGTLGLAISCRVEMTRPQVTCPSAISQGSEWQVPNDRNLTGNGQTPGLENAGSPHFIPPVNSNLRCVPVLWWK